MVKNDNEIKAEKLLWRSLGECYNSAYETLLRKVGQAKPALYYNTFFRLMPHRFRAREVALIPEGHLSERRIERMLEVLERIFCRDTMGWGSRNAPLAFEKLMVPFARGDIRAVRRRIPVEICARSTKVHWDRSESAAHAYMKRAGIAWMRSQGADDAIAEQRMGPYRFDGFSDKASWILEVGNTNSAKLDSAIEWGWVERFSLIPYQGRCDFLGAKEPPPRGLVVIDFEWEPGLVLEGL